MLMSVNSVCIVHVIDRQQREGFIQEMFEQVQVRGSEPVPIQPKTSYKLLFAYIIAEGVRKCRGGQDRTADLLVPNQAPYRWATPRKCRMVEAD